MENEILHELKKINQRLDILENKINFIIENNMNIEKDVSKMNDHINFVETVKKIFIILYISLCEI